MYISVYKYICMCIYVHTLNLCVFIRKEDRLKEEKGMCVIMYLCEVYIYVSVDTYIYVHVYIYMYLDSCVYIYINICIYMYIGMEMRAYKGNLSDAIDRLYRIIVNSIQKTQSQNDNDRKNGGYMNSGNYKEGSFKEVFLFIHVYMYIYIYTYIHKRILWLYRLW
jgi:hypothetical protein